jgi:hypothetical protein
MAHRRRFKVILEKAEDSEACGICIPFDVKGVFGRSRVPVRGTINGFPYRSTIVRMGGRFLMAVNRAMREGAGIKAGEVVEVFMETDEEPRVVTPPEDLSKALEDNPAAKAAWERLSYTHRKEFVLAIEDARKPETRARRIEKSLAELTAPKK